MCTLDSVRIFALQSYTFILKVESVRLKDLTVHEEKLHFYAFLTQTRRNSTFLHLHKSQPLAPECSEASGW
jgi:hypothetical protein